MKELGSGTLIFLVFIPFLIVVFKPLLIVKYFIALGSFFIFFLGGMILNDKGIRSELSRSKGWYSLFLLPLSFAFWYLISELIKKKPKGKKTYLLYIFHQEEEKTKKIYYCLDNLINSLKKFDNLEEKKLKEICRSHNSYIFDFCLNPPFETI